MYGHINPITNKFFYIGKGTGERLTSTVGRNSFWCNIAAKYGWAAVKIVDGLTEKSAFEIEKQYIARHGLRRNGGSLVNLTYGGEGPSGLKHTAETIEKCAAAKRGERNPNYGKPTWIKGKSLPEGQKQILRAYRTGKKHSPEIKAKVLAAAERGRITSLKTRTHKIQCLITGKVWNNRGECMEELGLNLKIYQQRIFRNVPIKGNHLQLVKN